jgi:hypothetical protein
MSLTPLGLISSPVFLIWVTLLFVAWFILIAMCKNVPLLSSKPAATAHHFVCIAPVLYLAFKGTQIWFFDEDFVASFQSSKMYGGYQPVQVLSITYFAHQIWDLVACLVTEDLRKLPMLAHHGLSAWLACLGLTCGKSDTAYGGFVFYYAPFFLGVSEVSSIPLLAMDILKKNKDLGKQYKHVFQGCQKAFAALFIIIRLAYWPYVSYDFWIDMSQCDAVVWLKAVWYAANIALTMLQFAWGYRVVQAIVQHVAGKPAKQSSD